MIARLNYYWRLMATGCCFAVFGLGGFSLAAVVFPVLRAIPGGVPLHRVRWMVQKSFGAFLWFMKTLGIMRMEVVGAERLANCHGALVLANHPTLIDVVAMVSLMPKASCVVKQALWKNPFLGGVVRAASYVSNSDPDNLIDDCVRTLRDGEPLLIFPEGTRTQPDAPLSFQRGAAYIALRSGVPVLPVLIDCNPSTLTKREKWYQIPRRPFHLRIEVLAPVDITQWVGAAQVPAIAARRLTQSLESYFTQELSKWNWKH